jgi:Carboxypeptidase regulatory-like domain
MKFRSLRSTLGIMALLLLLALTLPSGAWAQTFRGGINGTVTDQSGAVVAGASVEALEVATNISHKSISSSAGEFSFQEIPLGAYTVTVSASGFRLEKVTNIPVTAGVIYTLPVKLTVASAGSETVEVSASAYTLDTTTTTQTTIIDSKAVDDIPLNGRDFTQYLALTPGFSDSGAGGYGSLNGTRANQINWQIDGVDNNDIWHNIPAVNQGGVSGIAGIVLPIDAVEQFSAQTMASPETGRNPGGTVSLGLKSGTNTFHGSAYYFNRNEALGAKSPFSDTKQKVRNYNWGFSVGGPVIKDHLFGFITFEKQRFAIGLSGLNTEPSTAWQSMAADLISANEQSVSPVSTALLTLLYPSSVLTGGAVVNNYHSDIPEYGYSYNGVAKIDYSINAANNISFHWFAGQGNQVAPVGGGAVSDYYEVAPIHVQNYQLTYNHTFSPSLTNQVVAGVNYFNQVFNDATTGFDVASTGFITGSPFDNAPNLNISGFDQTGRTPPEGRNDITGQIGDNLSWVKGKHEMKMGGEFRKIQLNEFYHRKAQGSFAFNGTEFNWDTSSLGDLDSATLTRVKSLADFLSGRVHQGSITVGDPERFVYVNTLAFFGQDSYKLTSKLNVNYGLRWDYEGPLHNGNKDLSVFRPSLGGNGIAFQGDQISHVYDPLYTGFSPRVGFSYQASTNTVIRAGAGLYFDIPNINPFLDNRPGNSAPNGLEGNPAGASPVQTLSKNGYVIEDGVNPFEAATCSPDTPCGIFSVAKNFRPSSNVNYNIQVEQSITPKVIAQLGFVGSQGRHQLSIVDLNQGALQSAQNQASSNSALLLQESRPYFGSFPNYGNINEIQSIGDSNYASLQATLRASDLHHFSAQFAYTWSHSFDDVTAYRGALPQNSVNFKDDYGQSDFDQRNIFVGTVTYDVPGSHVMPVLTKGWQANAKFSFHSGSPFSVFTDDQTDGTLEGNQRSNQIGNPYAGAKQAKVGGLWLNPDAFADPAAGQWGTSRRNAYVGPGYSDVDLSIFKNTKIGERVNTQLRIEMFNLFNHINFAGPLDSFQPNYTTPSGFNLYDTIGDFNGAPGIGAGEAFNTQVALKITF